MRRIKLSLLMVLFSAPALAQTDGTYLLSSTNTVSPTAPTTTIGIWATWTDPGARFIFLGGNYDLTAGDGVFSNPVSILYPGFGSTTGVIAGNVISGAAIGQVNMCSFAGCPLTDNPILLATYDWTTSDFTPRSVGLDTSNTTAFVVQFWWMPPSPPSKGVSVSLYPHEFTPGSGVINVVPAPAVWVMLALPLAAST